MEEKLAAVEPTDLYVDTWTSEQSAAEPQQDDRGVFDGASRGGCFGTSPQQTRESQRAGAQCAHFEEIAAGGRRWIR